MTAEKGPLVTHLARAVHGDNLLRGYAVGQDLAGTTDAWSLASLVVGHRRLTADERAALDLTMVCHCAADPRVWPLKIVRLVASYGSQVPGIVAGLLSGDRGRVGWSAVAAAIEFVADAANALGDQPTDHAVAAWLQAYLDAGARAPGFGVPLRERDERVLALRAGLEAQQRTDLPHWKLVMQMDQVLEPKGFPINIGAASAAVVLDVGFAASHADALAVGLMFVNYIGNAVEGAAQAPEILRQFPPEFIEDASHPPRESPRARARRLGRSDES